jgi:hypothetical protein
MAAKKVKVGKFKVTVKQLELLRVTFRDAFPDMAGHDDPTITTIMGEEANHPWLASEVEKIEAASSSAAAAQANGEEEDEAAAEPPTVGIVQQVGMAYADWLEAAAVQFGVTELHRRMAARAVTELEAAAAAKMAAQKAAEENQARVCAILGLPLSAVPIMSMAEMARRRRGEA